MVWDQILEQNEKKGLTLTKENLDNLTGGIFEVNIKNYGKNRTAWKAIEDERIAEKDKKKKEKPIDLILMEAFLKDQRKGKIAEQRYFDKLEKELDKFEIDETLVQLTKEE